MPIATTRKKLARVRNATGKVSRWGNSLGLRIPREAVAQLRLTDGQEVSLEIASESITIRPTRERKKWTEAELLKGITPAKAGKEIDWGGPVGREVL